MFEWNQKRQIVLFAVIDLFLILIFRGMYRNDPFPDVLWHYFFTGAMGTGNLLFLIIFLLPLPFDSLTSAAENKDAFSGKLAHAILLMRIFCLQIVFFSFLASLTWLLVFLLPLIGPMFITVYHQDQKRRLLPDERIPFFGIVLITIAAGVFVFGLTAPIYASEVALFFLQGMPAGTRLESMVVGSASVALDRTVALVGIVAVAGWFAHDAFWRLRQLRQVENLPTSKVRAAAVGLVELQGLVRPAFDRAEPKTSAIEVTRSFYGYLRPGHAIDMFRLDDGTGSVLVDARGCRGRIGWLSGIFSIFGVREIVLTSRIERNYMFDSEKRTLNYGDRVYVIGTAEIDRSAPDNAFGSDALVIKPSAMTPWDRTFWRNLFGPSHIPRGKDIHNVFFLSDTTETNARSHIRKGFRAVLLLSFFWFAVSAALLWSTTLPERAAVPPDSWRTGQWRGPEPNPDLNVRDYTRNERLFRFERYIKSLGPESYEAVPALVEAIGYSDPRFYFPAIDALMRMMPKVKDQAKAAIPTIIRRIVTNNRNYPFSKSMIIETGKFGPDAAPAVPKLIQALQCRIEADPFEAQHIRGEAARALGEIGPDAAAAIPALQEALQDRFESVRDSAENALVKISGGGSWQWQADGLNSSRNGTRIGRFFEYMETIGPESYDAIPVLIEAMGYSDSRYYMKATEALMRMLPKAKEQILPALPLIMDHIKPCEQDPFTLEITIRAVGKFGPDAAPAVPKLIEALQCSETTDPRFTARVIRREAVLALSAIGPAAGAAVSYLDAVRLNDEDTILRQYAWAALASITGRNYMNRK